MTTYYKTEEEALAAVPYQAGDTIVNVNWIETRNGERPPLGTAFTAVSVYAVRALFQQNGYEAFVELPIEGLGRMARSYCADRFEKAAS